MKSLRIVHRTRYRFADRARSARLNLRLQPADHDGQRCVSHRVDITPAAVSDGPTVVLAQPFRELIVTSYLQVSRRAPWRGHAAVQPSDRRRAQPSPIAQLAASCFASARPLHEMCAAFMADLRHRIRHDPRAAPADPAACLARGRGVCEDLAALAVCGLRSRGLAVRHVSGYRIRDNGSIGAMHAWVAAFIPRRGWLELDPSAGGVCDDRYVSVAWGSESSDVVPISGHIDGGGPHTVAVSIHGGWDDRGDQ